MVKFSAFSDEVTHDFEGQVRFLHDQGVKFMEIRFLNQKNVMDLNKEELATAKSLLDNYGIGISAIGSPIGKIELDEPFQPHFKRFQHAVKLADFFNCPFIRVFSYYAPHGKSIDHFRDEVLKRFEKKIEFLKGSGKVLIHENETHIYGHNAGNCVNLMQSFDTQNFKLVYDPANFVWGEHIVNNMQVCWPVMKPWVVHVHIKDWKLGSTDVGSIPGEGDGQIPELLNELAAMEYNGFITMEPHLKSGGQFGGVTGPELFAKALKACRELCLEAGLRYE